MPGVAGSGSAVPPGASPGGGSPSSASFSLLAAAAAGGATAAAAGAPAAPAGPEAAALVGAFSLIDRRVLRPIIITMKFAFSAFRNSRPACGHYGESARREPFAAAPIRAGNGP